MGLWIGVWKVSGGLAGVWEGFGWGSGGAWKEEIDPANNVFSKTKAGRTAFSPVNKPNSKNDLRSSAGGAFNDTIFSNNFVKTFSFLRFLISIFLQFFHRFSTLMFAVVFVFRFCVLYVCCCCFFVFHF